MDNESLDYDTALKIVDKLAIYNLSAEEILSLPECPFPFCSKTDLIKWCENKEVQENLFNRRYVKYIYRNVW